MEEATPYSVVPCSEIAIAADQWLEKVKNCLETLQWPEGMMDPDYKTFMCYCTKFFVDNNCLWRKDPKGQHKMVIYQARWLFLMTAAHNDVGHHGFFVTNALLTEWYWWPNLYQDITWFVLTCRICQLQKVWQVLIPPIIAMPVPLFSKVYMDTMHMLVSGGFKYIIQGCCSLTHWPEWDPLQQETGRTLANFILNNIIYRWGLLLEIVTNNGPVFLKALSYLEKHYHIKHIRISVRGRRRCCFSRQVEYW